MHNADAWARNVSEVFKMSCHYAVHYVVVATGSLALLLASCASPARDATAPGPGEVVSLHTSRGVQQARVFVASDSDTTVASPLIVVLHGDAPSGPPAYQYAFAEELARRRSRSVVAALLRPGYSDPTGLRSAGRRGFTNGDNYTPKRLDTVAQAIRALQARYRAQKVILVGHSGGAAIAADLMGRETDLAQAAVLASCPCDLEAWRKHMSVDHGGLLWQLPVRSLSPMSVVENIPVDTRMRLIVGSDDSITTAALSRKYTEALMRRDLDVELTILPDQGHEILNQPAVIDEVVTLVEEDPNGSLNASDGRSSDLNKP